MKEFHPATVEALDRHDKLRREFGMTGDQAAAAIHVQISPETEHQLRDAFSDINRVHDRNALMGVMTFMGINYYTVLNLPEPGWRVIAPQGRLASFSVDADPRHRSV